MGGSRSVVVPKTNRAVLVESLSPITHHGRRKISPHMLPVRAPTGELRESPSSSMVLPPLVPATTPAEFSSASSGSYSSSLSSTALDSDPSLSKASSFLSMEEGDSLSASATFVTESEAWGAAPFQDHVSAEDEDEDEHGRGRKVETGLGSQVPAMSMPMIRPSTISVGSMADVRSGRGASGSQTARASRVSQTAGSPRKSTLRSQRAASTSVSPRHRRPSGVRRMASSSIAVGSSHHARSPSTVRMGRGGGRSTGRGFGLGVEGPARINPSSDAFPMIDEADFAAVEGSGASGDLFGGRHRSVVEVRRVQRDSLDLGIEGPRRQPRGSIAYPSLDAQDELRALTNK